jgi:cytochrome c oxidase assembly factor CtaG
MPMRPPTWGRLPAWHPQPVPVLCVLGAVAYVAGLIRLRRRGDRWPAGRIVS